MPIVNGAYDAPTWNNNAPPAIDASELQDMCDTIETYGTQKADVDYVNTFVRPNLLDNAYFVGGGSQQGGGQFPINQRGATSYTGDGYGIDRWKLTPRGGSLSLQSDSLYLYPGTTGTKVSFISQKYENPADLYNQTCTLSFLLEVPSGTSGQIRFMDSAYNLITGASRSFTAGETLVTFTAPVTSAFDNVGIVSSSGSTGAIKILACKLEIGSTQTLAHQENGVWVLNEIPGFEVELAKCQRFQTFLFGASNYGRIGIGVADSATAIHVNIPIPTQMRINAPALTFLAGSISDLFLWDAAANTYASITAWNVTSSFSSGWLEFYIESSGLTVGKTYILRTKTNTVQVLADANL